MYTVDGKDTVKVLEGLPQSCVGAPLPVVLSDEYSTFIAYLVEERDSHWDGTTCRMVGPESDGEPVAIVRFMQRSALMFGPPNDEAFAGHPLASRGLEPYGAFEVLKSSWIRTLERMNSVHPRHSQEGYDELRHFVLTFHDSTFECVACGAEVVELFRGSINDAVSKMAKLIGATAE